MAADTAVADWSAIPCPALSLISSYLAAADHIRFRSVCSSWRAAVPRRLQLPFLIGQRTHFASAAGHRMSHAFFGFDGERLPYLADVPFAVSFCCSSDGWLALLDRYSYGFFLWNPVTGARVQLPPIAHFPNKVILSSSDPAAASSECVVLLIYDGWERLSFCRPGDDSWTPMETPPPAFSSCNVNVDGLFFKGQFYLAIGFRVFASDLPKSVIWKKILPREESLDDPQEHRLPDFVNECYLVESQMDLLLVIIGFPGRNFAQVLRLYWVKGQLRLLKLHDLGDRAVFVGRNNSFCTTASMLPGCRSNCIYRACDKEKCAVAIHLQEDCRNELIPIPSKDCSPGWRPCAWFTPSSRSTNSLSIP